jgi:hypothetical protein
MHTPRSGNISNGRPDPGKVHSHANANDTKTLGRWVGGAVRTWLMIFSVAAFMPLVWIRCCRPLAGRSASSVAVL